MASNTPRYVCRNCGSTIPNPGAVCTYCGVNNSTYGNYNTQYGNDPYQSSNQYPPNQYPTNQYPNQYPPNQYPTNQYPPNRYLSPNNGESYFVPPPPQTIPPVPPSRTRRSSLPLIIAIIVVVIVVIAAGSIFAATARTHATNAAATAQAISTQNTAIAKIQMATAQAQMVQATATAQASIDPYAPQGTNETLALTDSLAGPDKWQANTSKQEEGCNFSDGFHLKETQANTIFRCEAQVAGASYDNLSFQVDMTIVSGDCGGLTIRDNGSSYYTGYLLTICSDSSYFLYSETYDSTVQKSVAHVVDNGTIVDFKSDQTNKVAIMAKGSLIEGYVNGKKILSKNDTSFLDKGLIGLVVIDNSQATEVKFANAKVWSFTS